jgi:hypothetical protein
VKAKVRRLHGYMFLRWEAVVDDLRYKHLIGYGIFKRTAIWDLENKISSYKKSKQRGDWEEVEINP